MKLSAAVALSSAGTLVGAAPCDIYYSAGTPCVAAHSVTRALYQAYGGALYQVRRTTDNATLDIAPLTPGGFANAPAQDSFCGSHPCVIQRIYDQSPMANHLDIAPPGGAAPHPDSPVNATAHKITAGGHELYGAFFQGAQGYRIDNTSGIATGNDPETLYMLTSGLHVNNACCFDYGNAETDNHDDDKGAMEAVYFGTLKGGSKGAGAGPWVQADLENGLWGGGSPNGNPNNQAMPYPFVTAMVKGGSNGFAIKAAHSAQSKMTTMYDGPRPNGYQPMKKQGAIILGIGGDNSDWAIGTFYEGVITKGYTTDAADDAVQANIYAAGYGQ